jgi:hypothetical protein
VGTTNGTSQVPLMPTPWLENTNLWALLTGGIVSDLKQIFDQYGLIGIAIPVAIAVWHWFKEKDIDFHFRLRTKRK